MKGRGFSEKIFEEHRAFITDWRTREAFDVLSKHAFSVPGYECTPTGRGQLKKSMRYLRNGSEYSFAFIVNRAHLLFYVRLPALHRKAEAIKALRAALPERSRR